MKESNFIRRVHRRLDKRVYRQHMPSGSGTPDYYYEGPGGILWVEYKVHPNWLSRLQELWIERARGNGVPVWIASWIPSEEVVHVLMSSEQGQKLKLNDYVRVIETKLLEKRHAKDRQA